MSNYYLKLKQYILKKWSEVMYLPMAKKGSIIAQRNYWIIPTAVLFFAIYSYVIYPTFSWRNLAFSLAASIPIGVTLAYLETKILDFKHKHHRTSFFEFLFIKTVRQFLYLLVTFILLTYIISFLNINHEHTIFSKNLHHFFHSNRLKDFTLLGIGLSILANFTSELRRKFGESELKNFVLGKYHKPRYEERAFLFIDLNNSTSLAERLGEKKYSMFLQDLFYDMGDSISNFGGEPYQYVGDEIVVTWNLDKRVRKEEIIWCYFDILKNLERYKGYYLKKYNHFPTLKAGLHGGRIMAAEVGKYKVEIAYHGDAINTTARLIMKCNDLNASFLTTEYIVDKMNLPSNIKSEDLGYYELKGKSNKVKIISLSKIEPYVNVSFA